MLLSFFFLLGFLKWLSTFSPLNIWSVPAVHMWIKDFLALSVFPSSFPSWVFSNSGPQLIYIYIFFFFLPWTVLSLRISQFSSYFEVQPYFINFIPYPVADPSPPFTSVLMMLVFKGDSLHIPTTLSLSNTNTFSISLSSPCSPF